VIAAAYLQGMLPGRAYRLRIDADKENRQGRYTVAEVLLPRGVEDVMRPGEWALSGRREWKPRGTWTEEEREWPSARIQANKSCRSNWRTLML
jgi:hypothetical protein